MMPDLEYDDPTGVVRPEPVGFRWYLHSALPVSWLASEVMPVISYLRQAERLPVVNVRRGWLHGTHLEVVACSDDGRLAPWTHVMASLRPPVPQAVPSQTEESYLARARELGRLEQRPGPYLPLQAHGTVEWLANSDLRPWPGVTQSLRERALTKMIDSLAVTLAPGQDDGPLGDLAPLAMVAEIMLAVADAHPFRIPYGAFSFRSHAEAFLNWSSSVSDPLPEFRQRLSADEPTLRPLVERMLSGGDTASSASWRRTGTYCMGLFDGAVLAGLLTDETLDEINGRPGGVLPPRMGPPGNPDAKPSKSEFHAAVERSGFASRAPGWFTSYRVLLNLLYTQLPLLGVAPRQRYYLCWAIAETVDEVTGESWRDRMSRVATGGQK